MSIDDVNDVTPRRQYIASAAQTEFDYPFPIFSDADLGIDVDGEMQALGTDYTVTGAGDDTGGTITFLSAMAGGELVTVYRDTAIERTSDYQQNGPLASATFNDDLDKLTVICQELEAKIGRSLRLPITAEATDAQTMLSPLAEWLGKYITIGTSGLPEPADLVAGTVSSSTVGPFVYAIQQWEVDAGFTAADLNFAWPVGYVSRYGVLAGDIGYASANVAKLRKAFGLGGTSTYKGDVHFSNLTGADQYHIDDMIAFKDGVRLIGHNSIIVPSKTAATTDTATGWFSALRDVTIEDFEFDIDYDQTATPLVSSAGSAIHFGTRSGDSSHLGEVYDSELDVPMGNCHARRIRITTNNPGGAGVELVGGLRNVSVGDLFFDGGGVAFFAVTYEFGWATSGTTNLRQTSHARNLDIYRVEARDLDRTDGIGVVIGAAYNYTVDQLFVTGAASAFNGTAGESLHYRPWVDEDEVGAGQTARLTNIVGQDLDGSGIGLGGQGIASGGYLAAVVAAPPLTQTEVYRAETDQCVYTLNGFSLSGTANGNGVNVTAGRAHISNGRVTGFATGVVGETECTSIIVDGVEAEACTGSGMSFDLLDPIWSPTRKKIVTVRDCRIVGNSTSAADANPGISISGCDAALIHGNRIGYSTVHDGKVETTQGNGVQIGSAASNVVCDTNYVGSVGATSFAYFNVNSTAPSLGNTIRNPAGIVTYSGQWDGVPMSVNLALTAATPGDLAVTYGNRKLTYIKNGRRIDYSFRIETSAFTWTTASGNVRLTGLPYASDSDTEHIDICSLLFSGVTKANHTQFAAFPVSNQTYMEMQSSGTGQAISAVVISNLPTAGTIILRGSGHYFTA